MILTFGSLLAALGIVAFLVAVHVWEKRSLSRRQPSESELLFLLARLSETSEYYHFHLAGEDWNIPKHRVSADFNRYLLEDRLPHYVRDYLRKQRERMPQLNRASDPNRDTLLGPPGPSSNAP
jgi:hypothetical protein